MELQVFLDVAYLNNSNIYTEIFIFIFINIYIFLYIFRNIFVAKDFNNSDKFNSNQIINVCLVYQSKTDFSWIRY